MEELSGGKDFHDLPHLQMFAGDPLTKELTCQRCKDIRINQELMHILDVRDINFVQDSKDTFFQPFKEKRYCPRDKTQTEFAYDYLATCLPKVLVIRICDTVYSKTQVKILQKISLEQSSSIFYFANIF